MNNLSYLLSMDTSHIIVIILLIAAFLTIVFVSFSIVYQKKNKFIENTIAETNSTFHLTIDMMNREIQILNLVNISSLKKINLDEYLSENFDDNKKEKFNRWLFSLLNKSLTPTEYLELYIEERSKKSIKRSLFYKTIYRVKKVNYNDSIIHLEQYISPLKFKVEGESKYLKNNEEIDSLLNKFKLGSSLMIALITFYKKDRTSKNIQLDKISLNKIIDVLSRRLKFNRYITVLEDGSIAIFSFNNVTHDKLFTKRIESALGRFFAINNIENRCFNISIVYARNKNINKQFLLRKAKELSLNAINNYVEDNKTHVYKGDISPYQNTFQETIDNEVADILEKSDFTTIYRLIYSTRKMLVNGYFVNIIPNNKTLLEHDYFYQAVKRLSLEQRFFDILFIRLEHDINSPSLTKGESIPHKIYFRLPLDFIDNISSFKELLRAYPTLKLNLIFSDDDLHNKMILNNDLLSTLRGIFNEKNLGFYLELTKPFLPSNELLTLSDGLIISDHNFQNGLPKNDKQLLYTNLLIQLRNYPHPIVFIDVDDILQAETLISQKQYLLEGKFLETPPGLVTNINPRVKESIEEIKNKY